MDWITVTKQLSLAYDKEISCYQKILAIYPRIRIESDAANLDGVLELQLQQKEIMDEIDMIEFMTAKLKTQWQARFEAEKEKPATVMVAQKIKEARKLIHEAMKEKDRLFQLLKGRQQKKNVEIKKHRQKKNAHVAYSQTGKPDALFWDRKS